MDGPAGPSACLTWAKTGHSGRREEEALAPQANRHNSPGVCTCGPQGGRLRSATRVLALLQVLCSTCFLENLQILCFSYSERATVASKLIVILHVILEWGLHRQRPADVAALMLTC